MENGFYLREKAIMVRMKLMKLLKLLKLLTFISESSPCVGTSFFRCEGIFKVPNVWRIGRGELLNSPSEAEDFKIRRADFSLNHRNR